MSHGTDRLPLPPELVSRPAPDARALTLPPSVCIPDTKNSTIWNTFDTMRVNASEYSSIPIRLNDVNQCNLCLNCLSCLSHILKFPSRIQRFYKALSIDKGHILIRILLANWFLKGLKTDIPTLCAPQICGSLCIKHPHLKHDFLIDLKIWSREWPLG